jgi:hypothetical protein
MAAGEGEELRLVWSSWACTLVSFDLKAVRNGPTHSIWPDALVQLDGALNDIA